MSIPDQIRAFYRRLIETSHDDVTAVGWRTGDISLRNAAAVVQIFAGEKGPFSVYEVGCGRGAIYELICENFPLAEYVGGDVVNEMVDFARARYPAGSFELRDVLLDPPQTFDFVIGSGLFNMPFTERPEWPHYIENMLRALFSFANKGVAVNFLSDRVDWKGERGHYQNPEAAFATAQRVSRFVELRHAYYPWEFSLFLFRDPQALQFGPPPLSWPQPDA